MSDLNVDCRSLKDSLLAFLGSRVDVYSDEGSCVVTLPMRTLDNRYVVVYVETTAPDRCGRTAARYLVHDGGDAAAELFLQGVKLTDAKLEMLHAMAKRYGASFSNNAFTVVASLGTLNEAIMTVAQCATTGMYDLLKVEPVFD